MESSLVWLENCFPSMNQTGPKIPVSLTGKDFAMRRARLVILCAAAPVLLGGCFGEEEETVKAPAMDFVMVVNKAAVDYKIRITTRMQTEFPLPYKAETKIEFPATASKVVQVKAISLDRDWNDCISSLKVGQTMAVVQVGETVECRPE
jgi:hypothetical protein